MPIVKNLLTLKAKQLMFGATMNSDKSTQALQQLEQKAFTQVSEIMKGIYEKDQIKSLTKVAMADDMTAFNDDEFDKEYTKIGGMGRYRQH